MSKPSLKLVYVGSIDPSLSLKRLGDYFKSLNLSLTFRTKGQKRYKNYIVARTNDMETFKFLTHTRTEHQIGRYRVTTDEYLTGNQKRNKDIMESSKRIYVGNLPQDLSDQEFRSFFAAFGKVKTAYINPRPSGPQKKFFFGFVTFENEATAKSLVQLKNLRMNNSKIFIKEFKSKSIFSKKELSKDNSRNNIKIQEFSQPYDDYHNIKKNNDYPNYPRSLEELQRGATAWGLRNWYIDSFTRKHVSFENLSSSYRDQQLLNYINLKHFHQMHNLMLNLPASPNRSFLK